MVDLAGLPGVATLHRAAMFGIRMAAARSELPYRAYRKMWRGVGQHQTGTTYFGAKFEADIRDSVPTKAFFFGAWEPNISHQIKRRLRMGRLFVDVGSNFGYYSLLASKALGADGGVVAVEASPRIFQRLNRNLARNGCSNVRTVNAAASDREGELTVYAGPSFNTGATSTLEAWRHGEPEAVVPALPLDVILTPEERMRVGLIKIDVEGAELPILRRLRETSGLYPTDMELIVEFSPFGDGAEWGPLFDDYLSDGFLAYGIENQYDDAYYLRWREPCRLQPLPSAPDAKMDILFTRDRDAAAVSSV
jgi:FkbM family methyltransferase